MANRHNYRWKEREVDTLFREYELLELTPEEIALRHERTVSSILFRLRQEGIIDDEARNGWVLRLKENGMCWSNNSDNDLSVKYNEYQDSDSEENDNNSVAYSESISDSDSDAESDADSDNSEIDDKFKVEINGRVLKLEESLFDMKTMIADILKKLTKKEKK